MSYFAEKDLTEFKSPFGNGGKERFREYCAKYNLDYERHSKNLEAFFASLSGKIHVQANERQKYYSWATWLSLCPELPQD